MLRLTLQDAQNDLGLTKVSGVCSTSPDFAQYVNEAQRRLIRRGTWFDTEFVVDFCISGSIIAWPRWVGTVVGVRFGKGKPGQLFNNNFSFVGPHFRHNGFHCNAVIEDANLSPTANDITGTTGKLIRYYTTLSTDIGKNITFFGTQFGNQPLMEQINGVWNEGLTFQAAVPYATSATLFTSIQSIRRDATDGPAFLYEVDPATGLLRDLAAFEPGDTNPRIRRSRIVSKPFSAHGPDANGICWTNLIALVKLQFIPVVLPRDFLTIDNLDALKFMFQALKYEEAGDTANAEACIVKAIRELNFELREKNPDEQTAMRVSPVMGRRIKNPI